MMRYVWFCLNPQIYEGTAQIQRVIISRELLARAAENI